MPPSFEVCMHALCKISSIHRQCFCIFCTPTSVVSNSWNLTVRDHPCLGRLESGHTTKQFTPSRDGESVETLENTYCCYMPCGHRQAAVHLAPEFRGGVGGKSGRIQWTCPLGGGEAGERLGRLAPARSNLQHHGQHCQKAGQIPALYVLDIIKKQETHIFPVKRAKPRKITTVNTQSTLPKCRGIQHFASLDIQKPSKSIAFLFN